MRVLFLSQYFHPETGAASERIMGISSGLSALGHDVTVVTGFPNYPGGRLYAGHRMRLWAREREGGDGREGGEGGVDVLRVWLYVTTGRGALSRLLNYLSFMFSAFLASLLVRRPDVVVATSGPIFAGLAGAMAALFRRVPFVLDLRDVWPERIYAGTEMKRGFLMRRLEWLEMLLYRRASRIAAVTGGVRENILRKGVPPEKAVVITNGVDTESFSSLKADPEVRETLGIAADAFVAVYAGTLGLLQDTSLIVKAAARAAGDNVIVLVIGGGARCAEMKREAAETSGADNIVFVDPVGRKDLMRFLLVSDLGINANTTDVHNDMAIPVKIFPYMASGLPVLLANRGEIEGIVEGSGAGRVTPPGDAVAFGEALLEFARDPDLCRRCALNGLSLVSGRFSMRRLCEEYDGLLEDAVKAVAS